MRFLLFVGLLVRNYILTGENRIEMILFFPKHIMSIGTIFKNASYPSGNQGAVLLHKIRFFPKYK